MKKIWKLPFSPKNKSIAAVIIQTHQPYQLSEEFSEYGQDRMGVQGLVPAPQCSLITLKMHSLYFIICKYQ